METKYYSLGQLRKKSQPAYFSIRNSTNVTFDSLSPNFYDRLLVVERNETFLKVCCKDEVLLPE